MTRGRGAEAVAAQHGRAPHARAVTDMIRLGRLLLERDHVPGGQFKHVPPRRRPAAHALTGPGELTHRSVGGAPSPWRIRGGSGWGSIGHRSTR